MFQQLDAATGCAKNTEQTAKCRSRRSKGQSRSMRRWMLKCAAALRPQSLGGDMECEQGHHQLLRPLLSVLTVPVKQTQYYWIVVVLFLKKSKSVELA
jgi:hypothetical protein